MLLSCESMKIGMTVWRFGDSGKLHTMCMLVVIQQWRPNSESVTLKGAYICMLMVRCHDACSHGEGVTLEGMFTYMYMLTVLTLFDIDKKVYWESFSPICWWHLLFLTWRRGMMGRRIHLWTWRKCVTRKYTQPYSSTAVTLADILSGIQGGMLTCMLKALTHVDSWEDVHWEGMFLHVLMTVALVDI